MEIPLIDLNAGASERFLMRANEFWKERGYEVLLTGDQSPTLRPLLGTQLSTSPAGETFLAETMHHRGGAFSETQLIYGGALKEALDLFYRDSKSQDFSNAGKKFSILSVGLGLGYNEILIACECLQRGLKPRDVFLESFEKDAVLVEAFSRFFLENEDPSGVYRTICEFYLTSLNSQVEEGCFFKISVEAIQNWLAEFYKIGHLKLRDSLHTKTVFFSQFNLIFYDAFSSKTDPGLWEESFLSSLWGRICASPCVFSTYACTGSLKRSLKSQGFSLQIKEGFQSKRDRTYAVKNQS